ncbi:MAG: IS982 family transposase [Candidatus Methanomethylicaceae archaeon]
MFDEELFIIAVYCLIDEYYHRLFPQGVRQRGFAPQLTDVEALTIGIVGEFLGLERDKATFEYFYKHYRAWFPTLWDRSLLVRQWENLWQVEQLIWQQLVRDSGAHRAEYQVIDTLPIPVCSLKRAKRRRIFTGDLLIEPDVGYCASKDWHYFGVKGGLRIAANGMIVHAPLLAARPHDSQLRDALLVGTPAGTMVLADKAFLDEEEQTRLRDEHGLLVLTPLRRNMQPTPFVLPTAAKGIRQLIETVNGQLVERFKVQNLRVRKGWTLVAKWYTKSWPTPFAFFSPQTRTQPP